MRNLAPPQSEGALVSVGVPAAGDARQIATHESEIWPGAGI